MRVPTTTKTGPDDSRRRNHRRRPAQPRHSHKIWTSYRVPVTLYEQAAYSTYGTQNVRAGSDVTPYGFQGGYTDPTKLIYLINRYYDPATDQFLSSDPMVATTGQPYAFTGDDPLDGTDPLGRDCQNTDTCPTGTTASQQYNSTVPTLPVSVPGPTFSFYTGGLEISLQTSATVSGPNSLQVALNPSRKGIGVSASAGAAGVPTANVTVTREGVEGVVSSASGPVSYGLSTEGGLVIDWSQSLSELGDTLTVDATTIVSARYRPPNPLFLEAAGAIVAIPALAYGATRKPL
jgi:RHS repeat-associated protein